MHPKHNYTTNYNKWSLYVVSVMLHISETLGTFPRKKDRGNNESTKTEREVF